MDTPENPPKDESVASPGITEAPLYVELRRSVAALSESLTERYRSHLRCGAGCSACCQHDLSVFPVEESVIRKAINGLSADVAAEVREQAQSIASRNDGPCPFLVSDNCAIYEYRPLICMTQGLPLMFEAEDGEPEVDFCPLNFDTPEGVDSLSENALVPLDAMNMKLAIANAVYCKAVGDTANSERKRMSSIILETT